MKLIKITLLLSILVLALVGALFLLKAIDQNQAMDYGGKLAGVILLFGFASILINVVLGRGKSQNVPKQDNSDPHNPGPRF